MDWIMIVLILTTAPNYSQSHTHQFVNFASQKLCADAAAAFILELAVPSSASMKVEVRAVCAQRK